MVRVTRVWLLQELDPLSPGARLAKAIGDAHTVRALPDGLLDRAEEFLSLGGQVSSMQAVPIVTVDLFPDAESKRAYVTSHVKSTSWKLYSQEFRGVGGIGRNNVIAELDEDDVLHEVEAEIRRKYGFLAALDLVTCPKCCGTVARTAAGTCPVCKTPIASADNRPDATDSAVVPSRARSPDHPEEASKVSVDPPRNKPWWRFW